MATKEKTVKDYRKKNFKAADEGKIPSMSSEDAGFAIRERIEEKKMKGMAAEAKRRAKKMLKGK